MSTKSRMAASSATSPRPRRVAARRMFAAASFALALPLLAACSSDDGSTGADPSSAMPSAAPAATTSESPDSTIAANGDPFCELAVNAQAQAIELTATTSEVTDLMTNVASGTAPVSDLNAWGSSLYDLTTSSLSFYDDAAPYVAGTEGEQPMADTRSFVSTYSIKIAEFARDAPDGDTFVSEVGELFADPEVQAVITTGPTAAQEVATYIAERCPATS